MEIFQLTHSLCVFIFLKMDAWRDVGGAFTTPLVMLV